MVKNNCGSLEKDFWLFRSGQIVSLIGDQLASIGVAFYILTKTGSASEMSLVLVPSMFLGLFLVLFLGPLADKFERKKFIIFGNLLKAIIWSFIVILLAIDKLSILALVFLFLLNGIGTALIVAGSSGFLPELVSENKLQKAFQVISGTNSAGKILGGICAGAIIGILGMNGAFALNALSFLFVMFMAVAIKPKYAKPKTIISYSFSLVFNSWKKDLYEGLQFVLKTKVLKNMCFALFLIQFIIGPMQIALPVYVKNHLEESSTFLGILISAQALGAILSSITIGFLSKIMQKDQLVLLCFVLAALGISLLGISTYKYLSFLYVMVCSMGITSVSILINTNLMIFVSDHYRSRFFTIVFFLEGIALPLGLITVGYLIDYLGVTIIFLYMGLVFLFLVFFLLYAKVFYFLNEEKPSSDFNSTQA